MCLVRPIIISCNQTFPVFAFLMLGSIWRRVIFLDFDLETLGMGCAPWEMVITNRNASINMVTFI